MGKIIAEILNSAGKIVGHTTAEVVESKILANVATARQSISANNFAVPAAALAFGVLAPGIRNTRKEPDEESFRREERRKLHAGSMRIVNRMAEKAYPYYKETGSYLKGKEGNKAVERDFQILRQIMHEVAKLYPGRPWSGRDGLYEIVKEHLNDIPKYRDNPDPVWHAIQKGLRDPEPDPKHDMIIGADVIEAWEAIQLLERRAKMKRSSGGHTSANDKRWWTRNKTIVQAPSRKAAKPKPGPSSKPPLGSWPRVTPDWPFDSIPPERRLPPGSGEVISDARRGGDDKWFNLSIGVRPHGAAETNPAAGGTHRYPAGHVASIFFTARPGYKFKKWILDNVYEETEIGIDILMDRNHTVLAVFEGGSEKPGSEDTELKIDSDPRKINIRLNNRPFKTLAVVHLRKGTYVLSAPEKVRSKAGKTFEFIKWEDDSKDPVREIIVDDRKSVKAFYEDRTPPEEPEESGTISEPEAESRVCPKELVDVAKWLITRMPDTAFEVLWPTFRNQPVISRLISMGPKNGGVTEQTAKMCFWEEYTGFHKIKSGKNSGRLSTRFWSTYPGAESKLFRKSIGWEVPKYGLTGDTEGKYKMTRDPQLRSAINRGKHILRRAARQHYLYVLRNAEPQIKGLKQKMDDTKKALDDAEKNYKKAVANAHKYANKLRQGKNAKLLAALPTGIEDVGKMASIISKTLDTSQKDQTAQILGRDMDYAYDQYKEAKGKYENLNDDIKKVTEQFDPRNFYNSMKAVLDPMVDTQSGGLAASLGGGGGAEYWRYGISGKKDAIKSELEKEADFLARYYGKRMQRKIKTSLPSFILTVRSASAATQTFGETWTQFLHNIWNFVFGPWTIGTIFVIIQFFFVLTYVGYNLQLLWVMPIIAAAFTFLLNAADTTRPFDWVTHLAAGAMIGYSAEIFLIALGAPNWSFISGSGSIGFWIAWAILVFIGVFQFYHSE